MRAELEIKPISAASDDESERDLYRALRMIHSMAGTMSVHKVGGWELTETNSSSMYGPIITVWNNGIVDVRAESNSDPERHVYSMYEARRDDE